ncbi:hypothetical protein E2C01_027881 [Portunus trituberculatus]|uniref:Uncharacterized protein n=1 Tax=Portunus trituberculatus TaxID=210409 RepID=A0A5B7EMU4_PORTR|nr:hypothetical protein [Portunus trituberculatus]
MIRLRLRRLNWQAPAGGERRVAIMTGQSEEKRTQEGRRWSHQGRDGWWVSLRLVLECEKTVER